MLIYKKGQRGIPGLSSFPVFSYIWRKLVPLGWGWGGQWGAGCRVEVLDQMTFLSGVNAGFCVLLSVSLCVSVSPVSLGLCQCGSIFTFPFSSITGL